MNHNSSQILKICLASNHNTHTKNIHSQGELFSAVSIFKTDILFLLYYVHSFMNKFKGI